jgi:hypothetical protein
LVPDVRISDLIRLAPAHIGVESKRPTVGDAVGLPGFFPDIDTIYLAKKRAEQTRGSAGSTPEADARWFLRLAAVAMPLPWVAAEFGWIFVEVGRQP